MKKILVCCNTGVTTGMLVSKMRQAAAERDMDFEVEAYPVATAIDHLADADVVLLAPQVGFAKADFENVTKAPVAVIDSGDYARADAPMILGVAKSLLLA